MCREGEDESDLGEGRGDWVGMVKRGRDEGSDQSMCGEGRLWGRIVRVNYDEGGT